MDNDEDDDGNFTKWMSSYWGHGVGEEHAKDRKRSFRRPSRNKADRRASLPCMVRVMQIAYVLFAMKNYGMEGVASKNFTVAIIFIKSYDTESAVSDYGLGRQSGRSMAHVHVVGVLHLLASEERRYRSVLDKRNIAYHVASSLYADNCIEKWLWQKQSCPTCRVHVTMPEPLYWSSARVQFP
ncbi:leukemia NUP98 fusion partner 1 isoform X2 [Labeo rohita]|nr:leukemia NUP98 fusion partner 1 isoform X2 [Labeo rohita]